MPGFDDDDGILSDDDGAPANVSATDLADAVAIFLKAADVVERSDAAAVATPADHELADDDPASADTANSEADAVLTETSEADAVLTETAELESILAEASELEAVLADAAEHEAVLAEAAEHDAAVAAGSEHAVEVAREAVEIDREAMEVDREDPAPQAQLEGGGRVDTATGWPSGSQRFAVIASNDDRPVERAVMESNAIDAGALEDCQGEAAAAAASHVEPAAE
jgi:hypothetical protein